MTVTEKQHFKEQSKKLTQELAELRRENKQLKKDLQLWKMRVEIIAGLDLLNDSLSNKE